MDLSLASHRAILKALQALEDGELTLTMNGPLTVQTTEGDIRILDGVCFKAPRNAVVGGELVGWLEELDHLSGVGAWWRPGTRAVLRLRDGHFAISAPSTDLSIGGLPAASGFATHSARFLVAHGENDGDALRSRGTWRTTAVVPWNLGNGVPVTRGPRETYGLLPSVIPPPPRSDVYTSTRPCVRPPVPTPRSRSEASPMSRLSRVAS